MKYISKKSIAKTLTTSFLLSLTTMGAVNITDIDVAYASSVTNNYGYRKTTAGINLYSNRGSGTLLAILDKGTVITLQESSTVSHTWIKVYDSETNQVGYVHRNYLTSTNEVPKTNKNSVKSNSSEVQGTNSYGYRKTTSNTSMYSNRGYGTLVTTVSKNSVITLEEPTSVGDAWIKVYDNNTGKRGYINRNSLAYTDEVPVTYAYGFRKTTDGINLYSERGAGTLLTILDKGTVITLQESPTVSHTWIKVYDSKTNQVGYVHRGYLTTASTTEIPVTNIYGNVKANAGINLYSDRGYGTLLTIISSGTVLSLQEPTSVSHAWIKVYDSKTKQIGYVDKNYLTSTTTNTQQTTPVSSQRDAKIEKVIALAKQQLGKKYVYGTAGPNTFDCSGFTSYVFKNSIGVSIPRTSSQQAKTGTKVALGDLKRGDLVIFGNKSTGSVSHVAIYLGNNEYIHSPQTGDVVRIAKTSSSHFKNKALYGRRVL